MTLDVKKDFPIFSHHRTLAYLDSAATAQMPRSVLTAIHDLEAQDRANIHRGTYALSEHATDLFESARKKVAGFIGAQPEEIIFTSGTTDAMNKLAHMLEYSPEVGKGNHIALTVMEHHSAFLPFQELAKRQGYSLSLIPITENYLLDYDAMRAQITKETRLVIITLASNVLGTINDVREVVAHAHNMGALVIVDAAQAVGHIPVSVTELACDFLVFSGHKMGGPMGIGVLYGREELLETLYPGAYGGGMVADVATSSSVFVESPHRFEPGTQNVAGAIGLAEATTYLEGIGLGAVRAHTEELLDYSFEVLLDIPGIAFFAERNAQNNVGIISLTLHDIHPHDIAEVCGRNGVAVRAGHHCALPLMKHLGVPGTIRASIYCYTTKEDIDRLGQALREVTSIFTS